MYDMKKEPLLSEKTRKMIELCGITHGHHVLVKKLCPEFL